MTTTIIDSVTSLVYLLNHLENSPTNPPSLYLDIEGVALSRHGSISIIQLFHLPQNYVFLIDVFILQEAAFNTPNQSGTTLRSILESATVPKVFFDVRNDADALYAHFNISLQGVQDVQLLEVATRSWAEDKVAGLASCIKRDAPLTAETRYGWKATKDKGKALFDVEHGGSYEVFNIRPMLQDIVDYCAQDVVYLPVLWDVYSRKIGKKWLERVQEETRKRVLMSQAESYEPHGEHKVLSQWVNTAIDGKEKKKKKNQAGKPRMREIERKGILGVRNTEKRENPSFPQMNAANVPDRKLKAEKQSSGSLFRQWPVDNIASQASKQIADLIPAQVTPGAVYLLSERPRPLVGLPIRNKAATCEKAAPKAWTCTTCSRKMQKTSRQDHLTGKAHLARLKQITSIASTAPLQPTTAKEKSPRVAAVATARSKEGKAKPATQPPRENLRQVKSKSTRRKSGAAAVSAYTQQAAAPFSYDWGFIGFEQNPSPADSVYAGYDFGGGGGDYGLCDKDCGWCGRCMDGVDV